MESKATRKAIRNAQIQEHLRKRAEQANMSTEEIKQKKREKNKRDAAATREMVRKVAENMDFSPGQSVPSSPAVRTGPRGGKYTEAVTKEGRKYRRYF